MPEIDELVYQMMTAKNTLIELTPTNNTEYNKIIKEMNSFLLKYCNHVWINDSIDIDLDKSQMIRYCKKCCITL